MNSPRIQPTPNWKGVIFSTPDWPDDLVVPQTDPLVAGSEAIQDSMCTKENWEWELWRHPEGYCYYLKIWPMDQGKFGDRTTPGAALTLMETFQFLLTNWIPRDVTTDLICDHPEVLKPFGFPISTAGLN